MSVSPTSRVAESGVVGSERPDPNHFTSEPSDKIPGGTLVKWLNGNRCVEIVYGEPGSKSVMVNGSTKPEIIKELLNQVARAYLQAQADYQATATADKYHEVLQALCKTLDHPESTVLWANR